MMGEEKKRRGKEKVREWGHMLKKKLKRN